MGAWPLHDSAAFWLAGVRLREGQPVYGDTGAYLAMWYSPPWVVIMGGLSLLPFTVFEIGLLAGQLLALRFLAGSWVDFGLLCWLPFVPRELATGNMDLLIAAALLVACRAGPSWPASLFAFAKFSPALSLAAPRARWREAAVAAAVLVALTLPWLSLWPAWIGSMMRAGQELSVEIPLAPRLVVAAVLLADRRPWSVAAAAATATPAFFFHTPVLYLAAARLWLEREEGSPSGIRLALGALSVRLRHGLADVR